jgi:hypothetical protein
MSKNCGGRGATNDVTIWRIGVTCWISKVTRSRAAVDRPTHHGTLVHTHTDKYVILPFRGNSGSANAHHCYVIRTLPVLYDWICIMPVPAWKLAFFCMNVMTFITIEFNVRVGNFPVMDDNTQETRFESACTSGWIMLSSSLWILSKNYTASTYLNIVCMYVYVCLLFSYTVLINAFRLNLSLYGFCTESLRVRISFNPRQPKINSTAYLTLNSNRCQFSRGWGGQS